MWQTVHNPNSAYFSTLTRSWELGVGSLLALTAHSWERLKDGVKAIASWSGLAMIAVAATTFSEATPFPGYHALLPVLGSALVLGGGISGPRAGARLVLDTRVMRWFGDISYSLYLWHWPLLILPALYVARPLSLPERVALMAAAVGVAWLSYRYVETPVRRHRGLATSRPKSLAMWPVAVGTVLAVGMTSSAASAALAVPEGAATASTAKIAQTTSAADRVRLAAGQAKAHAALPPTLHPTLDDLFGDVSRLPTGCGVERNDTKVSTCVLGDPKGSRTVVLFGDSHIIMWRKPLEDIARRKGWRIVAFQKASCFPIEATLWRGDVARPYVECDTWRRDALAQIGRLRPDLVITSGHAGYGMATEDRSAPRTNANKVAASADPLLKMAQDLRKASPRVVFIGAVPTLKQTAGDCLGSTSSDLASCVVAPDKTLLGVNDAMRRAAERTGSTYVDALAWMCADEVCPLVVGDTIVYRDTNHVTTTFASSVTRELEAAIPD
jgi:hypothetical protein